MATTYDARTDPVVPASVVEDARVRLAGLLETMWAARTPGELVATAAGLERLRSTLDAVQLQVVAEMDATKAAAHEGWGSTKNFLTAVSGGHKASGACTVRLAAALTGDRARLLDELASGRMSRAQVQVVVATLDRLPVKQSLRDEAEELLIDHARTLDASDLHKVGRHLVVVVDPDGDEREAERKLAREERAAHLGRFLTLSDDGVGGVRIKGRTTVEDAAVIKAALFPLAAPTPTGTPGDCEGRPGPVAPPDGDGCGGSGDGTASAPSSTGSCGVAGCAHDGRDPREHGARFLDAFVDACRRLLTVEVLPESHGSTPRITLTMDYTDLASGIGAATLDTGDILSASTVRRLACDADLVPMVLGSQGEVLDVGRTQRLVTPAIWKALLVRDKHCTFPGCRRPPVACDAHHLRHWADGGVTSLDNLALVCRTHHTTLHSTPWEIRLNPVDRRPEFLPPPHLDPQRRPIRHRTPRE